MRAVVFDHFGGPEVLEPREMPDPRPGPGEVVLRVRACGINHLDVWIRRGLPGVEIEMPHILGNDVVGDVLQVAPNVTTPRVGEAVWVHPTLSDGTCPACLAGEDNLCRRYDPEGKFVNDYLRRYVLPS